MGGKNILFFIFFYLVKEKKIFFFSLAECISALGVGKDLSDSLERLCVELGAVEPAADGAGLLLAEIDGSVLEISVVFAELRALCLVDDSEDSCNVLSCNAAIIIFK